MNIKDFDNKIRYAINDLLARNPLWQIFVLIVLSAVIIGLANLLIAPEDIVHESGEKSGSPIWWLFTRLLDQGTCIGDYEYETFVVFVGIAVTFGGILVLSLLIGIFSSKITQQIDSLKKGKSPIIQKKHLIVCGSGDRMYEVVRELVKASEESTWKGKIVLFSTSTREEIEEILSQRLAKNQRKKVICRSGLTTDIDALELPRFDNCQGFVIVGDNDANIIKTLIAVETFIPVTTMDKKTIGVCEIRNKAKEQIAKIAYKGIHTVPVREIIMRLLVQIGRQPGLSSVYKEILSFDGNEFYLNKYPSIAGTSFRKISRRIQKGIVVGIKSGNNIFINPSPSMVYSLGDELIVLAENAKKAFFKDETICVVNAYAKELVIEKPLRILVFSGWSISFDFILNLLEKYSMPGTEILVVGSIAEEDGVKLLAELKFATCSVSYSKKDRNDPSMVKALKPEKFNTIIVVSGKGASMTDEEVDSECIVTLLILKHIRESVGKNVWNATVVSEIRNPRNRKLASTAGIDDYVISNEVCSMIMAQLVIQPHLDMVYEEIFDPKGCEIQLRNALNYKQGKFCEIVEQGFLRNEIVLGWLTGAGSDVKPSLNPDKNDLVPIEKGNKIIVIAER